MCKKTFDRVYYKEIIKRLYEGDLHYGNINIEENLF